MQTGCMSSCQIYQQSHPPGAILFQLSCCSANSPALYAAGTPPVDLLLLMAASENDAPKVAELLRAGAKLEVKVTYIVFLCSFV